MVTTPPITLCAAALGLLFQATVLATVAAVIVLLRWWLGDLGGGNGPVTLTYTGSTLLGLGLTLLLCTGWPWRRTPHWTRPAGISVALLALLLGTLLLAVAP